MKKINNVKKELTLEAIAELINASANETRKSLEAKISSVENSLEAKISSVENSLEAKISLSASETITLLENKIESSVGELAAITQNNFLKLESKIEKMESDIEDIKLDTQEIKTELNKKVDKIDHNTLIYRVEKLEKKFV